MTTQTTCQNYAAYRYTWPGRDEAHICVEHAGKLRAVANAMGLHLQLIQLTPVPEEEHPKCDQQTS